MSRRRLRLQPDQSGRMVVFPAARLVGLRVIPQTNGGATGELVAAHRHTGPGGVLHGGILCDLVDATMGIAFASTLHGSQSAATVELKTNFLRPVWRGRLVALAQVLHRGSRLGLVECEVRDDAKKLIAKATSTYVILQRPFRHRASK